MRIDSHQHFWKFDPVRDAWIDESMLKIKRDFLPEDLQPVLNQNKIDGCVAVQADQSPEETEFLLDLAQSNQFIKGVVGWVDLCSEKVGGQLEHFAKNPLLKGIRHIVQAEQAGFMLREDFQNGISKLKDFDLTYDILIYPNQLEEAIEFVSKNPHQAFVLDHLAKPYIKDKKIKGWSGGMMKLSSFKNVYCKLSGLATEADWNNWTKADFKSYLEVALKAFGVDRLMFGSDWPVCLLAGDYSRILGIIEDFLSPLSVEEQSKIMGENARKFYKL